MIWLTADAHYMHENIIKYCNRPFEDVRQMDATIIKNYNEMVADEDEVWFLGDMCLHTARYADRLEAYVRQLRGKKHLVLGNHDRMKIYQYRDMGFRTVHSGVEDFHGFVLNHDPSIWCVYPDKIVLCGHVHGFYKRHKNVINVGVDVWDYEPVSLDTISELVKEVTWDAGSSE